MMSWAESIKWVIVHTINLAMALRRLRDGIKQHTKKQLLKTGCYQSSQIKGPSIGVTASISP